MIFEVWVLSIERGDLLCWLTYPDMRGHLPWSKASRAALTARSTSALSASATWASTSPVRGSRVSNVLPAGKSTMASYISFSIRANSDASAFTDWNMESQTVWTRAAENAVYLLPKKEKENAVYCYCSFFFWIFGLQHDLEVGVMFFHDSWKHRSFC